MSGDCNYLDWGFIILLAASSAWTVIWLWNLDR